jgi:diguanylate cyclase (GGDEF)-like protein
MRYAIGIIDIAEPDVSPRPITISIGVAAVVWPSSKRSPQELIDEADRALYLAKRNGRNRVEVFRQPTSPPSTKPSFDLC